MPPRREGRTAPAKERWHAVCSVSTRCFQYPTEVQNPNPAQQRRVVVVHSGSIFCWRMPDGAMIHSPINCQRSCNRWEFTAFAAELRARHKM